MMSKLSPLLRRVAEQDRPVCGFLLDGEPCTALAGDTVFTAVLSQQAFLRHTEFSGGPRAGFCLMGACQDCWLWLQDGRRVRACTTLVQPGMALRTTPPEVA
ncbi:(2Fe-2S)-binding protein [Castellaniella hirudinis]|uniref:(2Fe-2S)-binding protein n=1 Tax=Castellaniella hirudinis TaxID=1144617 RepID=UPI0039C28D03